MFLVYTNMGEKAPMFILGWCEKSEEAHALVDEWARVHGEHPNRWWCIQAPGSVSGIQLLEPEFPFVNL